MEQETILQNLETLLSDLSIELRYEKGQFSGGLYRYKEKKEIIVNKDLTIMQKINILAKVLRENDDLDKLYIIPALREVIEDGSSLGQ
jgi:hypothetical protein